MWDMINTVAINAGSNFEAIIIIIAFFGGFIFYAKGFQVGTVLNMVVFGGIFMWFYEQGLNFVMPLIIFSMYIVIMALSFYFIGKTTAKGGVI